MNPPHTSQHHNNNNDTLIKPIPLFIQLKLELAIAWRYMRSGKRYKTLNRLNASSITAKTTKPFVSFISMLSMIGIALGVAALIVVMSVMNGFQHEVRSRMLSVISHVEVMDMNGSLSDWQVLSQLIKEHEPTVIGSAPFVHGQAMMMRSDNMKGVAIRGIDPILEPSVSDLSHLTKGASLNDLKPGQFGVFLGEELARSFNVTVGDAVNLLVPSSASSPIGILPRTRQLKVLGVFQSGHYEYDSSVALLHIQDAAKLFEVNGVQGLKLKLSQIDEAPIIAHNLRLYFKTITRVNAASMLVLDWSQSNKTWFAAVQVEKRMMFLILTLIIAVATFNLVSMLVMTVTEKQGQIAILRTLGATPVSIRRIFMMQGCMVGVSGLCLGLFFGIIIALNIAYIVNVIEHVFNIQFLPKEIYFISALPSDLRFNDVIWVATIAFVLAILSTLYPSAKASRINPVEALRYE